MPADSARLGATYRALARELDRTWQISYLSRAHAGDRAALTVRAGGATAKTSVQIPTEKPGLLHAIPARS